MTLELGADPYEACQQISPRHEDYAILPIEDAFDWSSLSFSDFEQLYLVVFRSLRRPEVDLDLLLEHDDRAYEEALASGGLLRYFKGQANERGDCLSFCLWETGEQARKAAASASHRRQHHPTDLPLLHTRTLLVEEKRRGARFRTDLAQPATSHKELTADRLQTGH